jgi:hypothetical protein
MRNIGLSIALITGMVLTSFAQDNPVETSVDTTVVESMPVDTLKSRFEKRYLLTSFDSGNYVIPRQTVLVNNLKYYTDSIRIKVLSVKVDTTKQGMFPIKSIKSEPKTFDDYKHLLWWLIPIALLIALILYLIFRKKSEKEAVSIFIPPIEEALQRLKELDEKQLLKQNRIKDYYTELTDIVRTYIEKDTHIPALESTTNELIETISDFNESSELGIAKETIKDLQFILQGADMVKFAKSKPIVEEIRNDRGVVERIIKDTQSAVSEKRRKEEQLRGEMTEELPTQPVQKSNLKRNLLIVGAIVIVAVIALSYWGYRYLKTDVLDDSIVDMAKKEWVYSSYGSPGIELESPEILIAEPVSIPEEMRSVVEEVNTYSYGNIGGDFYIGVRTMRFAQQVEEYDFEAGIVGTLKMLEEQLGTKFEEVEQDLRINNGVEGRIVLARYAGSEATKNVLTMMLFADETSMRQLVITQSAIDSVAVGVRDRILKSVSLNP